MFTATTGPYRLRGFTLIELMIVMAVIAVLVAVLLPALNGARERAAVVRACAELRQIGDALEGYSQENFDQVPPQRTYCETEKLHHWSDLPEELVASNWLPAGPGGTFLSTVVEDIFNPGHTYKYIAPGWGFHNNGLVLKSVWAPDAFPKDAPDAEPETLPGRLYDNVTRPVEGGRLVDSPIAWAVFSVGPRYDEAVGLPRRFPIARCSWYQGTGSRGVIPRIRTSEGHHVAWH